MLRRALSVFALLALALGVTACERDGDTSDEVVIVTPGESAAGDERTVISLPAITPGPAGGSLPGGDDPFCAAVVSAVTDYNAAISTYTGEILNASAAAGLSNDMSGINALGVTVNDLAIDARDRMEEALTLTDNKAVKDGITGMIGYIDAYLSPVALIMVAATDFDEFNTDIVALTQAQLNRINRQTGHADAVKLHTEERCGVKLDVLTAG